MIITTLKIVFRISFVILIILLIPSCRKEKPTLPIITTTDVTEISYESASSGGEVTSEGGASVVSRGVCWNTSADPTTADSITIEIGGLGSFTSNITQLTPDKMYYVRAYASNSAGTGYGNQVSFTTSQLDYRDKVTGEYLGICIYTHYSGNLAIHDTTFNIVIILLKVPEYGSLVNLNWDPPVSEQFRFTYHNDKFVDAMGRSHPIKLEVLDDILYFHYQPGLDTRWYDYMAKKKEI